MQKEECISLCEILEYVHGIEPDFSNMIDRICHAAIYEKCQRVYIGSSFCGQYFLHLSYRLLGELMTVCTKRQIKMTLVVPIFTEKHLEEGKAQVERLLEKFDQEIDEITVNDYGMMEYISKYYPEKRLNMGRLFMKDYREPRYEAYFNSTLKPKGFTNQLRELVKKYNICHIEFDPTHRKIDFSEKPESVEIGLYAPYAYITVGQICEVSGISKPIEKKFRPNEPCGAECYQHPMRYFVEDNSRDWRRVGRAIYFENKMPDIMGIEKLREIYAPLDWEAE